MKNILLRKRTGFTLVEIMVAVTLFSILSVAVYSLLKSSMDSTLKQKTQEAANTNAKAILAAISTDLKSSSVIDGTLPPGGGGNAVRYISSVICPATGEASTADLSNANVNLNNLISPGFKPLNRNDLINANGLARIAANSNRLVFYRKIIDPNDDGNIRFIIIEYAVELTNAGKSRLVRRQYDWPNTQWTGLQFTAANNPIAVNNQDFTFDPGTLNNPFQTETIVELPNEGDAIILYTARTFDDTFAPRRLSANQYFIKVIVLQTARSNPNQLQYNNNNREYGAAFFAENTFVSNDQPTQTLKNYRVAELDTIVNVLSSLTSN